MGIRQRAWCRLHVTAILLLYIIKENYYMNSYMLSGYLLTYLTAGNYINYI